MGRGFDCAAEDMRGFYNKETAANGLNEIG
jgi:hypothetical protein